MNLDVLRAAIDFKELISTAVTKVSGGPVKFMACCPFHEDRTPSFSFDTNKKLWHCFGCHYGGDVFEFGMALWNCDFLGACRRLAEHAGIELEKPDHQDLYEALAWAVDYYVGLLWFSQLGVVGRDYLRARGISEEVASEFRLGYTGDGRGFLSSARSENFELDVLKQAGLWHDGREYLRPKSIVIPLCDERGRAIGLSSRAVEGNARPKYVNTSNTSICRRGAILFGLDRAKGYVSEQDEIVLVEGQFDVMTAVTCGFNTVVATGGTITSEQASLVRRYSSRAVLVGDGDKAGVEWMRRGVELLGVSGVRLGELPVGEDPDSLLRSEGSEAFSRALAGTPAILFLADRFEAENATRYKGVELVRRTLQHTAEYLVKVENLIERVAYAMGVVAALEIEGTPLERVYLAEVELGDSTGLVDKGDVYRDAVYAIGRSPALIAVAGSVESRLLEYFRQIEAVPGEGETVEQLIAVYRLKKGYLKGLLARVNGNMSVRCAMVREWSRTQDAEIALLKEWMRKRPG